MVNSPRPARRYFERKRSLHRSWDVTLQAIQLPPDLKARFMIYSRAVEALRIHAPHGRMHRKLHGNDALVLLTSGSCLMASLLTRSIAAHWCGVLGPRWHYRSRCVASLTPHNADRRWLHLESGKARSVNCTQRNLALIRSLCGFDWDVRAVKAETGKVAWSEYPHACAHPMAGVLVRYRAAG